MSKIGVGVIGASPANPGWAVAAHIPAIAALPDFELKAVSTSRRETAEVAAQAFGVPAFDNAEALIAHPDVDLLVVAVKVPYHRQLILPALEAGKMVFSEWPLGLNVEEAEELAERAKAAGVRTAIGLQARYAPAVLHARDLISQGFIGDVLASTLSGSGMAWGAQIDNAHTYMFDHSKGATTLSVPMMHALDAVNVVLGEFETVSAASAVRRPTVSVVDTGETLPVTAPDHIALSGTLAGGAVMSAYYRGAMTRAENFRWEINGTEADLLITAANGNMQVADLVLSGGRGTDAAVAPIDLSAGFADAPGGLDGGMGANVLREYAALARYPRGHERRSGLRLRSAPSPAPRRDRGSVAHRRRAEGRLRWRR